MKNSISLIVMTLALVLNIESKAQCNGNKCVQNLMKYTLLKSYEINLPGRKGQMERPPESSFPVVLSKGTRYRIAGCPGQTATPSDMIYALYLGEKLISTNKSKSGKTYAAFEFVCNETGVYYLKAHFAAGTKGCGSASLSMSK